jgi:uncharacterized protein (DUF2141 family)
MKANAWLIAATMWVTGIAYAGDIAVRVTGVPKSEGTIVARLMDSEAAWDQKARPVREVSLPAAKGDMAIRFDNVPRGNYAVLIHHDENGNGQLDLGFMRMPKEGWGYSRNANPLRKARFDEARFAFDGEALSLEIILR